jgi:hypothetical protein
MTELKTKPNTASVAGFLQSIEDEGKRKDSIAIVEMMKRVTGVEPRMWGENIVGFGDTHYRYATGREGDWFAVGFSPRKQNLTVYLSYGFEGDQALMQKLGKHKTGKACLYINKLSDVDMGVLEELVRHTAEKK